MSNNHHEDERYKKYYDRPPQGEVPKDRRVKEAKEGGTDPDQKSPAGEQKPDPPRT